MCKRIVLRNLCDLMCRNAVPTDDRIDDQIKAVRRLLPVEKGKLLNRLLDDINSADSDAKYEAFEKGFLLGLLLVA